METVRLTVVTTPQDVLLCLGRRRLLWSYGRVFLSAAARTNSRFAMFFFRLTVGPKYLIYLLASLLVFVSYHFVPSVKTCRTSLRWTPRQHAETAHCTDPLFAVVCQIGSRYVKWGGAESVCRTQWHRPIKIVDGPRFEAARCRAEMGWLASYDQRQGCHCDYHSVEQHGLCVMTDEVCQELYGPGAQAAESGLGYPDQCRCGNGGQLEKHCDGPLPPEEGIE